MNSLLLRARLIRLLQDAHAGERAAYFAYEGHANSVREPEEKHAIRKIQREEWEHREALGKFLTDRGAKPRVSREWLMAVVGRLISVSCYLGGWFIPMYGAGRLERSNIVEYEVAARWAREAGHPVMAECLIEMAEVEWDHEKYFREKAFCHWMQRFVPKWSLPPPREEIRESFLHGRAPSGHLSGA